MTRPDLLLAAETALRVVAFGERTPLPVRLAAWYLDLRPSTIYKLAERNEISFSKPGNKRVFFLKEDLNAYALRRRRKSIYDLEQ